MNLCRRCSICQGRCSYSCVCSAALQAGHCDFVWADMYAAETHMLARLPTWHPLIRAVELRATVCILYAVHLHTTVTRVAGNHAGRCLLPPSTA